MQDIILEYEPIPYGCWIYDGKGRNIKAEMSNQYWTIWEKALSYQDKRDDLGQGEIVTLFACKLMEHIGGGDKEVVIPAAILHDIGWDVDPEEFRAALGTDNEAILRLGHEALGVKRAIEILRQVNWPVEYVKEIIDIIFDHDSRRRSSFRLNESIVRDSDILWRFTRPHRDAYLKKLNAAQLFETMRQTLEKPNAFELDDSRKIARIELVNTIFITYSEECEQLLNHDFRRELDRIINLYNKIK